MFLNRIGSGNKGKQKQVQEKKKVFDNEDFILLKEVEEIAKDLRQQHAPLAKELRTSMHNIYETGCAVERKILLQRLKNRKCSLLKDFKENDDGYSSGSEMKDDGNIRYAY